MYIYICVCVCVCVCVYSAAIHFYMYDADLLHFNSIKYLIQCTFVLLKLFKTETYIFEKKMGT